MYRMQVASHCIVIGANSWTIDAKTRSSNGRIENEQNMIQRKWFNQKIQTIDSFKSNCRCGALNKHRNCRQLFRCMCDAEHSWVNKCFCFCGKCTETWNKKPTCCTTKPLQHRTFGEFQSGRLTSVVTFTCNSCTNAKRRKSQHAQNQKHNFKKVVCFAFEPKLPLALFCSRSFRFQWNKFSSWLAIAGTVLC